MPGEDSARVRLGSMMWFIGLVLLLFVQVAVADAASAPKRIVALYWYDKDFPANVDFDRSFQSALESTPAGSIEYHAEYVDSEHFPGEHQSEVLHDYLRKKYADHPIDVVVALSDVALEFLLNHRDDLFTHTPIVFVSTRRPNEAQYGPGLTGIVQGGGYRKTLDLAIRLHPGTKQVFIISGTLSHDKEFETLCRQDLEGFDKGVSISYLTDLPVDQLIFKLKSLPERSLVLYIWQQSQNEEGLVLESRDVLASIASSAKVPIYGVAGWQVGRGIVGGYLRTFDADATRAGEIALRIANGAQAHDIPIESSKRIPMFDWGELKRWGISEDFLPPGSIVLNRRPTVWESYKWYIIGGISLILVEALLIFALLWQRARRRKTEEALAGMGRRLMQAHEEERTRIARELHDDINQQIALSAVVLDQLKQDLPESASASLEQARQHLVDLGSDVQALSHRLHSSKLEILGLVAAGSSYCKEISERQKVEIDFSHAGIPRDLPNEISLCLFRVLQEALQNAAKHSGVRHFKVELHGTSGELHLRVSDVGSGFELNDAMGGQGLGLISMRERVQFLNGEFSIKSKPNGGTTIYARVPVETDANPSLPG
jgi:signal transduction histidine kinase